MSRIIASTPGVSTCAGVLLRLSLKTAPEVQGVDQPAAAAAAAAARVVEVLNVSAII